MSEVSSQAKDFSTITSTLNIDEAIMKSRKVMEESKALTVKNKEKKSGLEEKFKNILTIQSEFSPDIRRHSEIPKYSIDISETPKSINHNFRVDELQNEIMNLNNKISSQSTNIKLLELVVSETKTEKHHLIEEMNEMK